MYVLIIMYWIQLIHVMIPYLAYPDIPVDVTLTAHIQYPLSTAMRVNPSWCLKYFDLVQHAFKKVFFCNLIHDVSSISDLPP